MAELSQAKMFRKKIKECWNQRLRSETLDLKSRNSLGFSQWMQTWIYIVLLFCCQDSIFSSETGQKKPKTTLLKFHKINFQAFLNL